ncbi:mitochondrial fission ELM1 family protein [Pseudomarimonas arenosa]|uniref:Mitochondrial fission ELM1 family protein n=1 Tax=Pseudomarimonas arenosa TaxID=2774145 RepID=A0AAW3ZJT0_9GAMM|nr:ELM1/GtrOC1 family putative glycosyltransferase [Pseudomarimonas arenosa]MBD8526246.1 mitochondrial fission ELM1 family protein [Pseudomarimonas arenosa]
MTASERRLLLSVSDPSRGNQRQADALAEALAERLRAGWSHYTLRPRLPWKWLAPRWLWGSAAGFDPAFAERLDALRPCLVIGCGRQAALATRIAKRRVQARTVQILDPRLSCDEWDLRVQPNHDPHRDSRTLVTRGSLHPVNLSWLGAQRQAHPEWGSRDAPRQLILLGGPTRLCRYGVDEAGSWLRQLADTPVGSRWVIGSGRTPTWLREVFRALPSDLQWWTADDGDNPYGPALAWADQIWVSPDSVNMISEAAATQAELLTLPVPRLEGRLAAFHQVLRASARVSQGLPRGDQHSLVVEPWHDLDEVVEQVLQRLFPPSVASRPT